MRYRLLVWTKDKTPSPDIEQEFETLTGARMGMGMALYKNVSKVVIIDQHTGREVK